MRSTVRFGSISFTVLLAGIFFVLLIAAGGAMMNQAKASSDLEKKFNEAQLKLAESGVGAVEGPQIKGAKIDKSDVKTYSKNGLEFSYPAALMVKEGGEDGNQNVVRLISSESLDGPGVVPDNQLKVTITRGLRYRFDQFDDVLKLEPYIDKNRAPRKTVINGLPAYIITNTLNDLTWIKVIFEESPDGPYTVMVFQPGNSFRASDAMDIIIPSVKLKELSS